MKNYISAIIIAIAIVILGFSLKAGIDNFAFRDREIKNAHQGQFSIDDSDSSTPYIKKVRVVATIVYYLED